MNFYERAIMLIDSSNKLTDNINQQLMKEFNLRSDEVSRNFKSFTGMTIREALEKKHLPSRKQIENALVLSKDVNEMISMLNLKDSTSSYWKGLLDREFGYSTYTKAKANFIIKQKVGNYNPTRADNLSIILSQRLGDGHIDTKRKALRIDHCEAQLDYLRFKVGLLNKAYPESAPINNIKRLVHKQGHTYVSYYSHSFSPSTMEKVISMTEQEVIDKLTPLGWLLWFLDDGHNSYSEKYGTYSLGIAVHSDTLKAIAVAKLKSFGYIFSIQPEMIVLQDKIQIASFISGMLSPFKNLVPECMHYKMEYRA